MSTQQIIIHGLRITGNHGVSPEERALPQPFEVDIVAEVNSAHDPISDRLEDTVDYEAICAKARAVIEDSSFALLERIAVAIADSILELEKLCRVDVTVKKIRPPMPYHVTYTAARVVRQTKS